MTNDEADACLVMLNALCDIARLSGPQAEIAFNALLETERLLIREEPDCELLRTQQPQRRHGDRGS